MLVRNGYRELYILSDTLTCVWSVEVSSGTRWRLESR